MIERHGKPPSYQAPQSQLGFDDGDDSWLHVYSFMTSANMRSAKLRRSA
jgi:hypothetical protein